MSAGRRKDRREDEPGVSGDSRRVEVQVLLAARVEKLLAALGIDEHDEHYAQISVDIHRVMRQSGARVVASHEKIGTDKAVAEAWKSGKAEAVIWWARRGHSRLLRVIRYFASRSDEGFIVAVYERLFDTLIESIECSGPEIVATLSDVERAISREVDYRSRERRRRRPPCVLEWAESSKDSHDEKELYEHLLKQVSQFRGGPEVLDAYWNGSMLSELAAALGVSINKALKIKRRITEVILDHIDRL